MTNETTDFSNCGWEEEAESRRRHWGTHLMM
jgi:hypothetical protein